MYILSDKEDMIIYIYSYIHVFLTMAKPLIVWITINCGKFFKRWEYQTT